MILRSYSVMSRIFSFFLLIVVSYSGGAQDLEYPELVEVESSLKSLFDHLYSDTLADPEPVLDSIEMIMPGALALTGTMEFPWKRLDRIGVIPSEDGRIRIFTWHVCDNPDAYRYFGYIQVAQRKGKISVIKLIDNHLDQRNIRKLEQSAEEWFGKLYYQIVTTRHKRRSYYTLLGMDFNDSRSIIKTIEAMMIHRNNLKFEKGLFFNGKDRKDRLVLEYSSRVAMSVRYEPSLDMISFDHLVPFHPIYNGNYEFYGPDGSYDGLEFAGGIWIFREDIDARNLD